MSPLGKRLRQAFRDKDYRHPYVDEFLNSSIATQIKVLREQRGWSQKDLADKAGMKQPVISRIENVNYSSWSINTLRKIAEAFDLTLRVTFESFGTRLKDITKFSRETLKRLSFEKDPEFKKVVYIDFLQEELIEPQTSTDLDTIPLFALFDDPKGEKLPISIMYGFIKPLPKALEGIETK